MKCYNCDHKMIVKKASCEYCHFPSRDSMILSQRAIVEKSVLKSKEHAILQKETGCSAYFEKGSSIETTIKPRKVFQLSF